MKTRNPIAKQVTRIKPQVVPDKRLSLRERIMNDPDIDIDTGYWPMLELPNDE